MLRRGGSNPGGVPSVDIDALTPMELVDLVLDRELDSQDEMRALAVIEQDPRASAALEQSQWMLDELRNVNDAPDFSDIVLEEVGARRGWLPPRLQRLVPLGRLAAAAVLLGALSASLLAERAAPDAAVFQNGPTPVADVVRAGSNEAIAGVRSVSNMLDFVRAGSATREITTADYTFVIQLQSERPADVDRPCSGGEVKRAGCASEALRIEDAVRVRWFGEQIEHKGEVASRDSRRNEFPRR
jgi:hypothetical protein